jgi:hypothetical protein
MNIVNVRFDGFMAALLLHDFPQSANANCGNLHSASATMLRNILFKNKKLAENN